MLRSAACCLYLLQNLNGFKPAEGVSLTLHMGVGVGLMSAFYVGGARHIGLRPPLRRVVASTTQPPLSRVAATHEAQVGPRGHGSAG